MKASAAEVRKMQAMEDQAATLKRLADQLARIEKKLDQLLKAAGVQNEEVTDDTNQS